MKSSAYLERALSVHMAILAVLGTMLLALGQQKFTLPFFTLIAAILAVYFTDFRGLFRLNRTVANAAALAAVGLSLADYSQFNRDYQLLAVANLLVYLQVVVLFQEKNPRIYWQLLMLSLLQVVVAAALNYLFTFGLLLVVYLFVALSSLSLFFVYRETRRSEREPADPERQPEPAEMQFFSNAPSETTDQMTPATLMPTTCIMAISTLAITVVLFLGVPRVGNGPWRSSAEQLQRTVGFSPTVTLGELGEVVQNTDVVMRLKLVDTATDKPFRLKNEPLLRGSVVVHYINRSWAQRAEGFERDMVPLDRPATRRGLVRQEISLQPLDEPVIFGIYPPLRLGGDLPLHYDRNRQQMVRRERFQQAQMNFEIGTSGIRNQTQYGYLPGRRMTENEYQELLRIPSRGFRQRDPFFGLKRVAKQVVEDAKIPPTDRYGAARTLERFLLRDGGFQYSLTPPERDPKLDPIEDFVVKNRHGHCEFFASALTLMLRSQGIPARMVIGFKGGTWNAVGSFYQFRQLHAHTWVEAYLSPEDLVGRNIDFGPYPSHGAWMILDPTAGSSESTQQLEEPGVWTSIGQMVEYVNMLWVTRVVSLTQQQQQRTIYQPITEKIGSLLDVEIGSSSGESVWDKLVQLTKRAWKWLQGNWFSWRGGLAAILFCLGSLGIIKLGSILVRLLRRWLRQHQQEAGTSHYPQIDFYRNLETLLARHGYQRPSYQTQREFAAATAGDMAAESRAPELAQLPRQIVDAFYLVRFGRHTLDKQQAEAVEHALAQLEASLSTTEQRG